MYDGRKAKVSLHFIVVGGGIGGLSAAHCLNQAGHKVTVIDPSELPAEIGAGLSLSPNVTRLLYRWGLKSRLDEKCAELSGGRAYSFDGDKPTYELQYINPLNDGAKFYGVHRPYLVTLFYDLVKDHINIVKGKVVTVDPETPSVTLETGEVLAADVVIGADGVGSVVRPTILPPSDKPVVSGDVTYRALIPVEEMKKHPELDSVPIEALQFWDGPGKRTVSYGIGHGFYNFVLIVPDSDPNGPWSQPADLRELESEVQGWTSRAQKLVSLIKSAIKFRLVMRTPTETWVHPSGRVALLGDSAHAMLPYYAQGAAMAIEDAAVLGNIFSRLSSRNEISGLLQAYQNLRAPRSNATHAKSLGNGNPHNTAKAWREREGEDACLPKFIEEAQEALKNIEHSSIDWRIFSEKQFVEMQYAYDADEEVDKWWADNRQKLQSRL